MKLGRKGFIDSSVCFVSQHVDDNGRNKVPLCFDFCKMFSEVELHLFPHETPIK